ncbi:MAG: hypothetical protein ABJE66_04820 [Deltaproteobacteria bacterium]
MLLLAAAPAAAAPKGRAAKAQFDKGVAAYGKSDFATASLAFGKSYALEVDVETLFAWAQAERKQGHCDKATELYHQLLATKLPAENKAVVQGQLDECKKILDDEQAQESAAERARIDQARAHQPRDDVYKPPLSASPPAPVSPSAPGASGDSASPSHVDSPSPDTTVHASPTTESSPWFKDPAGDTLLGLGVASVAVGGVLLLSASSASADSKTAATYDQFKLLDDKAKSRGTYGVIATGAGAALIIAGVIRYSTRSTTSESTTVTGWLDGRSSGIAITGGW